LITTPPGGAAVPIETVPVALAPPATSEYVAGGTGAGFVIWKIVRSACFAYKTADTELPVMVFVAVMVVCVLDDSYGVSTSNVTED
jgi:hypothetical protein